MNSWLHDNDIEMYSTHNEGKSVVAERFIRIFKTKICKHMTGISKKIYVNKLDKTVSKYNNAYYKTIEMKPVDVQQDIYIEYGVEYNDKDSKLRVSDHVKI